MPLPLQPPRRLARLPRRLLAEVPDERLEGAGPPLLPARDGLRFSANNALQETPQNLTIS